MAVEGDWVYVVIVSAHRKDTCNGIIQCVSLDNGGEIGIEWCSIGAVMKVVLSSLKASTQSEDHTHGAFL